MDNLLLNSLAVHHSRAFHDLKKERPDQVDLLVSKHNSGETLTAQKQATGTKQKNTEQNAHYLLTILTRPTKRASSKQPASKNQKNSEQNAHYLLTILTRQKLCVRGAYNLEHPMPHRQTGTERNSILADTLRRDALEVSLLPRENKRHTHPQKPSHYHLHGSMSDQFPQALFSKRFALKGLVDHLIEDTRLDTDGATYACSVIHHDTCQDDCDGKSG